MFNGATVRIDSDGQLFAWMLGVFRNRHALP